MRDFGDDLGGLRRRLDEAGVYLRVPELRARLPQLETEASRPDLWDDADLARKVTGELSAVQGDLDLYDGLAGRLSDAETLWQLAKEEGDDSVEAEIADAVASLDTAFAELELRSLFADEHDASDAVCEINSGEGGTDAQDWANMLLRMYLRWAERRGFDVEVDDVSAGAEAGISSATFVVKGRYAYGWLKSERGVHRLVRISPFNSQGKRQTAFASFAVVPMIEDGGGEIEIDEKDLRVDTYRSSGAGGQHVNKTDSAVRITHLPTGIVTSCQNERSQHQNRERALQILKAKLAELERQRRDDELTALRGEQHRVGFGSQIRSYVVHPYQMVKDLRTGHEAGNVEAVLDGDLDRFMEAWLRWQRAGALEVAGGA